MLLAFLTTGGVALGPNTWVEIVLTTIGAALLAAVALVGARGRAWGGATLLLFVALSALTFASIAWSVQPANSWVEANRTLSYLAAFAAAMALARLAPARWRAVIGGVATGTTLLAAYALLVKVFPGTFDPSDTLGRLHAPFDYYNATGLIAALGIPACVWAGARDEARRPARALAVPAIAVMTAVLVLSYGRGALAAAVIGLVCWFALVPYRLRGALMLGLGTIGGGSITAWALATHPLSHDHVSLHARTSAGHTFGVFLVLLLAALTLAGFAAVSAMDRIKLARPTRRRLGIGLVTAVAVVPVLALGVASSSRGLGGEVSHVWNALTNPKGGLGNNPGRLAELSNSRPRYWSLGLKVGEHALLGGVGALGYATAHTRYTTDIRQAEHAHSYLIETFADLGLVGLALSLALLMAWGIAAARTLRGSREVPGVRPERAGMITLLAVVVVFGVHSLIDWTWFIPGTAIPALLCAGWLAGRGPLSSPVGRRPPEISTGQAAAVIGIAAIALLAAWFIWQPLRSADADSAAVGAIVRADVPAALSDARSAASRNPVSVEPLWELSAIYQAAGDPEAAHRELVKAVSLQPSNPATWEQLASYELARHQPRAAQDALRHAERLDRSLPQTSLLPGEVEAQLRQP
jgi:hypothetical protein